MAPGNGRSCTTPPRPRVGRRICRRHGSCAAWGSARSCSVLLVGVPLWRCRGDLAECSFRQSARLELLLSESGCGKVTDIAISRTIRRYYGPASASAVENSTTAIAVPSADGTVASIRNTSGPTPGQADIGHGHRRRRNRTTPACGGFLFVQMFRNSRWTIRVCVSRSSTMTLRKTRLPDGDVMLSRA